MKRNLLLGLIIVFVLIALFPVYWKLGNVGTQIYAEIKFDEMRWGPHQNMAQVDQALSRFDREEITDGFIPPYLLNGPDIKPLLTQEGLKFVAYYVGQFGFIVVFDKDGKKLIELKSDV